MTENLQCPKCANYHGNDWTQCGGKCPLMQSPHYHQQTAYTWGGIRYASEGQPDYYDPPLQLADDFS